MFLWNIKDSLSEVGFNVCKLLKSIMNALLDVLFLTFDMCRMIIYKILKLLLSLASIAVIVSLILFGLNFKSFYNTGFSIIQWKYSEILIFTIVIYTLLKFLYKLFRPKY